MKRSIYIALVGTAGAVALTAVSVTMPAQSTEDTRTVSVGRTTPSAGVSEEGDTRYFPNVGTVPVVTPSPKSSVRSSGESADSRQEKTRESRERAPSASPSAVRSAPSRSATSATRKSTPKKTIKVTTIAGYAFCGSAVKSAQVCIDQGKLTLYYPAGVNTLAGHNYMGYDWMDNLPVGRTVVIKSGGLRGTYKVYGHGWAQRGSKGGKFPANGYGAAVALQTCTKTGTGFSFLRKV